MHTGAAGLALATVVLLAAAPALPCSPPPPPGDPRFSRAEAPRGGTWWLLHDTGEVPDRIDLVADDPGAPDILTVDVVSRGGRSLALRVPDDAPVGARYAFPPGFSAPSTDEEALRVVVGDAAVSDADVPEPALDVDVVRASIGSGTLFGVPNPISPCGGGVVLAMTHEVNLARAVFDVPVGFVADVHAGVTGEAPFRGPVDEEDLLGDGIVAGAYELDIDRGEEAAVFSVHARLRRIDDGAAGPHVSHAIALERAPSDRPIVACVCDATRADRAPVPASCAALCILVALLLRRPASRRVQG